MPDAVPPLAHRQCPLCGQPNHCTPANTGSFAGSCWCKTQPFPPELLAQLAPEQRNNSCICQACVNHFHNQQSHSL
ncbi:cysteine-rich CWC family protein [Cellvibrio sp. OA-2007]|uniref:cysteine-rich CWC family protein n=1 Tax=Cellvibrio sp. OA-2007 TaxID=529823 RepID=UPI00187CB32D